MLRYLQTNPIDCLLGKPIHQNAGEHAAEKGENRGKEEPHRRIRHNQCTDEACTGGNPNDTGVCQRIFQHRLKQLAADRQRCAGKHRNDY